MNPDKSRRRILVIPNDPLYRYAAKGEVKERYFNPENFFDEVHVLSLADEDNSLETARIMAGNSPVRIHAIGRPNPFNLGAVRKKALQLALKIKPQVVRGYNPLYMGYLAVCAAKAAGAASVVSVHDDYSLWRSLAVYGPGFLFTPRGMYQIFHYLLALNRISLGRCDQVICAYRFPLRYVERWRKENISVIYNRVDLEKFSPGDSQRQAAPGSLRILNVGRQFAGKNPQPILKALAGLENTTLTLVGDGPYHQGLVRWADKLGIADRVKFINRVAHKDLPDLYRSHDIFAMAITQPGVCIPVLEAAASGLPIVINSPRWEDSPEVVGDLAEVVPLSVQGYRQAFLRLAGDPDYRKERGARLRQRALAIDGRVMERAERELYERLLAGQAAE